MFHLEYEQFKNCCGIIQCGNFRDWYEYDYETSSYNADPVSGDDWQEVIEKLRRETQGKPLTFAFAKHGALEESPYRHADLLELLYRQEDHLFLHEWVNPNSGNTVCAVMLTNPKGAKTNE